jgi:HEAT repeat protein
MRDAKTLRMLADYMENGFLENIIDMFRHDRGLYALVPSLMSDERSRVRIGAVALVEELRDIHAADVLALVPEAARLLEHENPTLRADAVYLLEVIGSKEAVPYLETAMGDESEAVKEVAGEALAALRQQEN